MADALTIGQVARRCGLGVETVRFYEREGLVPKPGRTASGYRQYPEDTVRRILFVRRAKEVGFTLREIKELLSMRVRPGTTCADIRGMAEGKLSDIDEKMGALRQMRRALKALVTECHGRGPVSECPVLEALDREEDGA